MVYEQRKGTVLARVDEFEVANSATLGTSGASSRCPESWARSS